MNKIPLQVRLKRELHRKIAYAQDLIVLETYKVFNKAVLYGGTAIWRCYSGKRFSEDLDFYLIKDIGKINEFFKLVEQIGFKILKKKVSENSIYSELEFERVMLRFEATFQKIKGILCDYELSDGNIIPIYSLTPQDFIKEKINTYLKRFKSRDLLDIFFLIKEADSLKTINKELGQLIKSYKNPRDEENLSAIILEGIIPSAEEMFDYIRRRWEKENT